MPQLTTTAYSDITDHLAEHAPTARPLEAIAAVLDADYHSVWLDRLTIWHAWTTPDDDTWHLEHYTAAEALDVLHQQLDGAGVFDRTAAPSRYADPAEAHYLERDEEVMEEYYDIELAAEHDRLPADATPQEVDRRIQARITRARAEAARLASLRAHHVRATYGGTGDRGWKAAAARGLGITPVSLGAILADDEARAVKRREARTNGD
ncbi:hypothetical protein [Streptosporangium jomthongense]|uniref:Uncharacterized protein n=1 Tax=Streptosporangium jomthongense TaxID=1193683 RepID=A0ABV8FEJ9_9ACTN